MHTAAAPKSRDSFTAKRNRMLSIFTFLVLMTAFAACVWYAVAHEDLAAHPRLGRLARALRRIHKRRSSPAAAPPRAN